MNFEQFELRCCCQETLGTAAAMFCISLSCVFVAMQGTWGAAGRFGAQR
jgi:hypothetical protein